MTELREIEWLRACAWIDSERVHNLVTVADSLVVEIPFAMSTFVTSPCLADANAGAVCYYWPSQQQQRRGERRGCYKADLLMGFLKGFVALIAPSFSNCQNFAPFCGALKFFCD